MRQIALNAGQEGAVIVGRIRESKDDNFGFNADTGEFGDLVKAGVIDPAKVTRLALQNAASIATLMLTPKLWWLRSRTRHKRPPPAQEDLAAAWAGCTKPAKLLAGRSLPTRQP